MSKKVKQRTKLRHHRKRKRKPPRPPPAPAPVAQTHVHLLVVAPSGPLDPSLTDAPIVDQPPSPESPPPPDVFTRQHLNPFFSDTRFDSSRWSLASLIAAFVCLALLVFAVILSLLGASWLPISLAALSSLLSAFLAKNFFDRHNAATAQSQASRQDLTQLLQAQAANQVADSITDVKIRDNAKGSIVKRLMR